MWLIQELGWQLVNLILKCLTGGRMLSESLCLMPLLLASFRLPEQHYVPLGSDYDFNSVLPLPVAMATSSFISRTARGVSGQHRHKGTMTPFWVNIKLRRHEVKAFTSVGRAECLTVLQVAVWFSCSTSVVWCSVRADAALSSLSGAVGGPVWMSGQSVKPHLTGLFKANNVPSHCTAGVLWKHFLK